MAVVVSVFGVEPFRIGGTETFARELSLQLSELDCQSVLCFLKPPPDNVRRFLSLPNVSIEVLENSTNSNLTAAKALAQIIRRHSPDLLHLHFVGFLGVYPWLARLLGVKQIFFTDHCSRPVGYVPARASLLKRFAHRIINQPIATVVCVSRYGLRCLTILELLPVSRHLLVYNGVDRSRVEARPERAQEIRKRYAIPEERTVVVQVSWMIPQKGIPELLQVAKELVARNANVHFVLVGEGAYRDKYMQDAVALGISDHITWTGLVEDPFSAGVYDVADIVCQLSDWEELFGWMIAEGMAYGKPIVATRVGGIPELVNEGVSGFLVERGEVGAAADRIQMLAADRELRKEMGRAGAQIVSEKFNLKQNVATLIKAYGV